MLKRIWAQSALGLFPSLVLSPFVAAQNPLDEASDVLEQWVDTERKIAEAESGWAADKASMENLIMVYEQEIEALREQIKAAESDVSAAEQKRLALTERRDRIREIEDQVVAGIIEMETMLADLETRLPPPLAKELTPLFNALPEDPEASKLSIGQRIQPIAGILTQIQKFNQVVTVIDDFREFEAGRTVQMKSIYFGLGSAYYVDQANEHAGYGVPGEDGWTWVDDDALAPEVRKFLNIYEGKMQAEYVELPVSVK